MLTQLHSGFKCMGPIFSFSPLLQPSDLESCSFPFRACETATCQNNFQNNVEYDLGMSRASIDCTESSSMIKYDLGMLHSCFDLHQVIKYD